MDRNSLLLYLLRRFGAVFGAVIAVLAVAGFLALDTTSEDLKSVGLLQETAGVLQLAEAKGVAYLASGKPKDLDAYNAQILKLGENFKSLSERFRGLEELQKPFAESQKRTTDYFVALNEKIQVKQNKPLRSVFFEGHEEDIKKQVQVLGELTQSLVQKTSQHAGVGPVQWPLSFWALLFGMLFSSGLIWMYHRLSKESVADLNTQVSELKLQSIILDGILNSISEALIVVDANGKFTRYNTAAERMIGKSIKSISFESDAQEFGFFDVETKAPVGFHDLPFARALHGEQMEDKEFFVQNAQTPNGMYISISSRYLSGPNGPIHGALVVFRDISRRKATEREWLNARESALETARKKSDFLAAMSHEIRTPMNGVMGMSTLLADTKLTSEQSDYVGTIKGSAEALLRLINDILDHSKIEAGMVEFQQKAFDLERLCGEVLELFQATVQEKNISLSKELTGRDAWNFIGDPGRIRQILVNLLGNAVKFTEVGGVKLKVELTGGTGVTKAKSKPPVSLKFSVIDTGAGFDEEESGFLFQKYFQTRSGLKYGGTGLGLSICHQLVGLMGGQMGLQSSAGKGSTFWFEIALDETTADQIIVPAEHSFAAIFSGHVLLAEDQIINQRVAVTYLQKLGLTVDVASNGLIALEKVKARDYDLVFMDCQMPVMTGYEATKKIRALQKDHRVTIVALTAEGTSGERKTCLAAGMDDFLTKPLELEKLSEVLHHWLKTGPQVLDLTALQKLKSFVVNNKSLTDALIEDFMKTGPELVTEMFRCFEAKDVAGISQAAHALKSCSATLGATGLAELCQTIEDCETLAEANKWLPKLESQLGTSSQELKKHWNQKAA